MFETVIGLEIHVELATKTKLFCGCSTDFGAEPNTQTCPVCLGHPGVLPVLNRRAVEYTVMAGLALQCHIPERAKFDRKHYYYPDMVKNYQISQYDLPLCLRGEVALPRAPGQEKTVRIRRVHLEEDTGKLSHQGDITASPSSLVDFNRSGVPLMEIVTEPDITSPAEAREFLNELKAILLYTGVSDVKMEEGSLRCDANVSLRPDSAGGLGIKTELKNMNSFRAVEKGLSFEVQRQGELLGRGEPVAMETRHWDEQAGETRSLRGKEEAHDYRYFPDPDLLPLEVGRQLVAELENRLPELPAAKRERMQKELGLTPYDAGVLAADPELSHYYEEVLPRVQDAKTAANWVISDLQGALHRRGMGPSQSPVSPGQMGQILAMLEAGHISSKIAKEVLDQVITTGQDPESIVEDRGWAQISSREILEPLVEKVLEANPQSLEALRAGKDRALGFLVGQVMQETRGRANPQLVNQLLRERIPNLE